MSIATRLQDRTNHIHHVARSAKHGALTTTYGLISSRWGHPRLRLAPDPLAMFPLGPGCTTGGASAEEVMLRVISLTRLIAHSLSGHSVRHEVSRATMSSGGKCCNCSWHSSSCSVSAHNKTRWCCSFNVHQECMEQLKGDEHAI